MLWLILLLLALIFAYKFLRHPLNYWKEKGISYVEPTIIVGNMDVLGRTPLADIILQLYQYYPDERYHGIYQFNTPTLLVKDPDLIKQMTVKDFDSFTDHQDFADEDVDPIWTNTLFGSKGKKWRTLRAILSPAFTGSKMRIMFESVDECAQNFVEHYNKKEGKIRKFEGEEIFSRYTNDVINITAFGIKCNSLKDKNNDCFTMGREATGFDGLNRFRFFIYAISPTLAKLFNMRIVSRKTEDLFAKMIEETVKTREKLNIFRPDMIHLLTEASRTRSKDPTADSKETPKIEMSNMVALAFNFVIGSFEGVAANLAFTFYELALNPNVQDKLREEINRVSKKSNGKLTYEALLGMKFLDGVVLESLRKWPSSIFTDRQVTKPYTIQPVHPWEKPLLLDKGVICMFPLIGMQRDSKYFENPEKFDPERFNEENKSEIYPMTYAPFGFGPRKCLGAKLVLMQVKLLLYYVLEKFQVVPVEETPIPIRFDGSAVGIHSKEDLWLGLKPISKPG